MLTLVVVILCIVVGYSARSVVKAVERRNAPSDSAEALDARMIALEHRLADLEETTKSRLYSLESSLSDRLVDLSRTTKAAAHDSRVLLEAVKRIDPTAIRTMEAIVSYDDAAEERYAAHATGQRHCSDFEPSVQRLDSEIHKIRQELREVRSSSS